MNVRKDWMTNNQLFGSGYPNPDLVLHDAKLTYEQQRDFTNEGKSGYIDGVAQRFVIQEHTNSLEKMKETKKLFADRDSNLQTGSYVTFDGNTFLVPSEVLDNGAYLEAQIIFCNIDLKWKVGTETYTCKATNKILSESKNGEHDREFLTTISSDIRLWVQENAETITIDEGTRLFIGRNVYKVGYVQDAFIDNILFLYMHFEEKNDGLDNTTTGIANNNYPDISI